MYERKIKMGKVNDYIEKMLKYLKIEINYNKENLG